LFVLYGYRAVASSIVAYPMARTLASFGAAMAPKGDRSLFEPGGFALLEALRRGSPAIGASAESGALVGGFLAVLALVPLAACLAILVHPDDAHADVAQRSVELFPIFLKLGASTLCIQGAVCAVAAAAAPLLSGFAGVMANEQARDVLVALVLLPAAAVVVAMGVWEDFARVAAVFGARRVLDAARGGWTALVRRPGATFGVYLATLGAGWATVALSAAIVGVIDVSRGGSWRIACAFAVHQGALLVLVALRVLWLLVGPLRFRGGPGGHGLPVDLDVAASGSVPTEIEAHDTAAKGP
jgi:hypothetical protein